MKTGPDLVCWQDELWLKSKTVAEQIITGECSKYLDKCWHKKQHAKDLNCGDADAVLEQAMQYFRNSLSMANPTWFVQLTAEIYEFLLENPAGCDTGAYFRFRLQGFLPLLEKALERSWSFWQERNDYAEFVRLVRPYLQAYDGRVLQLVFSGGEWCFYDVEGKRLQLSDLDSGSGWELAEALGIGHEESLVHILLNYAPDKVLLHLGYGEAPFESNIIADLLGSRLVCCNGCEFCRQKRQPPFLL